MEVGVTLRIRLIVKKFSSHSPVPISGPKVRLPAYGKALALQSHVARTRSESDGRHCAIQFVFIPLVESLRYLQDTLVLV